MLNKSFKNINNKFSRFFRFIFFLRYLFLLFFIALASFITIPYFFDYEKRVEIYKNYLSQKYNFKINKYEEIKYKAFPIPRLVFKDAVININSSPVIMNIQSLKVYPKIFNIYDLKNFKSEKITFLNNYSMIKSSNLKFLNSFLFDQKNKFSLNNFNLKINNENKTIINVKNMSFSNYGYKKNLVKGEVFGKKFKSRIINNFKSINFELLDTGINAELNIDKQTDELIIGSFKSKILNTKLRFDFNYNEKELNIYNSFLRNKNFSLKNQTLIVLDPFFDIRSEIDLDEFNFQILQKINFSELHKFKDYVKKINIKNEIFFKSKGLKLNPVDDIYLKIDLAYGRLNYVKKYLLSDDTVQCEGSINLFDEFPLLYFNCKIISANKKNLFKKFSINTKNKDQRFELNVVGNLSLLNKKINFKNISINENYKASKDDLEYFKLSFEKIIYDKSFFEIFDLKKIKDFIQEIS